MAKRSHKKEPIQASTSTTVAIYTIIKIFLLTYSLIKSIGFFGPKSLAIVPYIYAKIGIPNPSIILIIIAK